MPIKESSCVPASPSPPGSLLGLALPAAADQKITWKKTVLDTRFRSEGVAVADVNKDGKMDVLNGEYWYEAPDWKPHEMQPPRTTGPASTTTATRSPAGPRTSTATATRT